MSEKKFLTCILIEGIVLTALALCILILPKLTSLTFGVMLSCAFIAYGIYKVIHAIMNRNYGGGTIFCAGLGIFLSIIGILLLLVPRVSLLWLIALTGVYFLLESIASKAFLANIKNMYNFWGYKLFASGILCLIGIVIILGIPVMSFWVVAMLSGLGLLIKGMSKITLALVNRNNYNI